MTGSDSINSVKLGLLTAVVLSHIALVNALVSLVLPEPFGTRAM